jgi:DNA polymerase III epsilon subunit-like protein
MSNVSSIIIVFDTETTGFSPKMNEIVQLSYILYDVKKQSVIYATKQGEDIVKIDGEIPEETTKVHGITKEMTLYKRPIKKHIDEFIYYFNQADTFVGHNIGFDIKMIVGQIDKIINSSSDKQKEQETYNEFLDKFRMVGKKLPEAAFCTMEKSIKKCAEIKKTTKLKKEKLMEVHNLLFNQEVHGKLHNALVDISVTLRVYLKLTLDIDICNPMTKIDGVENVNNNNDICNLINPIDTPNNTPIENINYSGELITGLTDSPDGLQEEKIKVKTNYKNIAKKFVNYVQEQAMLNISKNNICTTITICKSIIKSGPNKGKICEKPFNICRYHNKKEDKPEKILAKSFVKKLLTSVTKKKKVVPMNGGKTKNKRRATYSRRMKK